MIRTRIAIGLLSLAWVAVSCRGPGGVKPGPEAPSRPGKPAAGPAAAPENLLGERERSQFYFDLDQYTQSYMAARTRGDSRTWTSLHASVLTPLVDRHLDDLLASVAKADNQRYRIIAARGLGFASDASRVVPALVELLDETDVTLVNSALVSLYYLASPETPLLPLVALLNHPDATLRSNDALALFAVLRKRRVDGRVPPSPEIREVAGRLVAAVSDPRDDAVRGHAAGALGEIGDPSATDILVNLLTDDSAFVRIRAAAGLGELGREQAIPALIDLLTQVEAPNEARVVAAALEKIARTLGFPCEAEVLGTDAEKWRSWYAAVKSE